MSAGDEEPYSTIFASLKHPIRRRILRMLWKKPMSFSEMLDVLGVSSSFLNYHLENLGELVSKMDDGRYRLSSFGEAALATMTKVEDIPTTVPQQSPQTRTKKIVGRSVPIPLGMICVLLIASLGGTIAYYTMIINNKENELGSANNTITRLNTNVTNLQDQKNQLLTWLQEMYNNSAPALTSLQEICNNSTSWINKEVLVEGSLLVYVPIPGFFYQGGVNVDYLLDETNTQMGIASNGITMPISGSSAISVNGALTALVILEGIVKNTTMTQDLLPGLLPVLYISALNVLTLNVTTVNLATLNVATVYIPNVTIHLARAPPK